MHKRRTPVPPSGQKPSHTGGRVATPSWESLSKLLECTVCFETMEGAIYQCAQGHCLCHECWGRIAVNAETGCPTCAAILGQIRCRFAEEVRDRFLRNGDQQHRHGISSGTQQRPLYAVPKQSAVKAAATKLGLTVEDLRNVMVREGVGLMDAVMIAARSKVALGIESAGGIRAYEKKKRAEIASNSPTKEKGDKLLSPKRLLSPQRILQAIDGRRSGGGSVESPEYHQQKVGDDKRNARASAVSLHHQQQARDGKRDARVSAEVNAAQMESKTKAKKKDDDDDVQAMYMRYKEEVSRVQERPAALVLSLSASNSSPSAAKREVAAAAAQCGLATIDIEAGRSSVQSTPSCISNNPSAVARSGHSPSCESRASGGVATQSGLFSAAEKRDSGGGNAAAASCGQGVFEQAVAPFRAPASMAEFNKYRKQILKEKVLGGIPEAGSAGNQRLMDGTEEERCGGRPSTGRRTWKPAMGSSVEKDSEGMRLSTVISERRDGSIERRDGSIDFWGGVSPVPFRDGPADVPVFGLRVDVQSEPVAAPHKLTGSGDGLAHVLPSSAHAGGEREMSAFEQNQQLVELFMMQQENFVSEHVEAVRGHQEIDGKSGEDGEIADERCQMDFRRNEEQGRNEEHGRNEELLGTKGWRMLPLVATDSHKGREEDFYPVQRLQERHESDSHGTISLPWSCSDHKMADSISHEADTRPSSRRDLDDGFSARLGTPRWAEHDKEMSGQSHGQSTPDSACHDQCGHHKKQHHCTDGHNNENQQISYEAGRPAEPAMNVPKLVLPEVAHSSFDNAARVAAAAALQRVDALLAAHPNASHYHPPSVRPHVPPATDRPSSGNNAQQAHRISRARAPQTAREAVKHAGDPILEAIEGVRKGDRSGGVWGIVSGVRKRLRGGRGP